MVTAQPTTPLDLCESSISNVASGIFFLLLAAGAFTLAWGDVLDLPADMADFPLEMVGSMFGAILIYMGLSTVFMLRGFRIDRVEKTIRRFRRGFFGRRYDSEISLEDLDHLRFTLDSRGVGSEKRVYYAVYLHRKTGEQVQVIATDLFKYARQTAERFARELNLNLHDDSDGGEAKIRKPEELDESVREKLRKNFSHRSMPSAPTQMRAKIKRGFEGLTIEIPRFDVRELGPMQKALWIFVAILLVGLSAAYYWEIGGVALFCVPVFLVVCYMLLRSEIIEVTRDALSVSSCIGPVKIRRSIPLAELEELHLTNMTADEEKELGDLVQGGEVPGNMRSAIQAIISLGSAITASSDKKKLTMGRMLSNAELDVILYEMESSLRE